MTIILGFRKHVIRMIIFSLLASGINSIVLAPLAVAAQEQNCVVGSSQSCPATSPQEIYNLFGTTADGKYWIKVNGSATQVYLKMNRTNSDNGGWVLLMKGQRGTSQFGYSSKYFTSDTETINNSESFLSDNVTDDAKFSAYNTLSLSKMLAVFKDSQGGTIPSGGDIQSNSFGGHVWLETLPSPSTAFSQLTTTRSLNSPTTATITNAFDYQLVPITKYFPTNTRTGEPTPVPVFSWQDNMGSYGFNLSTCSALKSRWGIQWNENIPMNFTSCDTFGGIGLQRNSANVSPGDSWNWDGVKKSPYGAMGFQIWGKVAEPSLGAPTSLASTNPSSGQVDLSWSALSGATDYVVQYKTTSTSSYSNSFVVSGQTTASFTGLTDGTSYDFRVFARTASNSTATPSTVTRTLKSTQTLSFGTTSYSKAFGETQTVTATSAGSGAITYSAGSSTACSVSGATVTITAGTGTCSISASRAEDATYLAANSTNSVSITVSRAAQSGLALSSTSGTYLTNLRLLSTGGSDTGTVSFAVSSTGTAGCSISNSDSLTSTSAGTCQVVATKAATNNYLPAYDTQTVTLGKASLQLTISVAGSSTIKYGGSTTSSFTTNRSLGTGNIAARTGTISYSATGSACSVNSSTGSVSMIRASGTCDVQISLANDSNYSDTTSTAAMLTAAKADTLTVTAGNPSLTYTGSNLSVPYTYSISGLQFSDTLTAISYSYSGTPNSGGSAAGSSFVDQAGTYTVTPASAVITNSDSYTAVTYATGTLTVNRASRTISGTAVSSLKYGSTETVSATTTPSSSLDGSVTFSAGLSSACSVVSGTGATSMNRAAGTCSITPSITQGNNYLAATAASPVSITPAKADAISVTAGNATATYTGSSVSASPTYSVSGLIGSDTVTVSYQYSGTDNSGGSYSLSSTRPTNAGTYAIVPVVTQPNSDSYTATATLVNGVLTVDRASRTLSATTYSASTLKYGASASVVSNSTTPSTNSDGEFSYAIGAGCSINSSTGVVTATTSSGTCSQTTTIGQGNNYLAAVAPSVSFTLSKADTLTVTSSTPAAVTFTGSAAAVSPSATVTGLVNSDTASGATYNYSRSTTCATGGTCSVGDTGPAGGIVFYVSGSAINAADGISTGGVYLEAAPATFSKTPIEWCTGGTDSNLTLIGASGTAIGTGALNTKVIIGRCAGGAGFEASSLTLGGKSDWFLPSQSEQVEMFTQKSLVGFGVSQPGANYFYFGSSEDNFWSASAIVPANGVGAQNKGDAISFWPIRAFSPTATAYSSTTTAPTNAGTYVITPSSLTLSGGASVDNYVAVVYETSTVTINKANQSIFSNYGSLEAILGNAFTIYPFGGNGDGAVYLAISNGTATGCSAGLSTVTAATAGTCILTITKSANENYNQAQASFSIQFNYFVPAAAAPTSSRPTEIAISSTPAWSSTATAVPSITSFSPTSGPVGTLVTITGVGLDGVNSVRIGRRAMTSVTGVSSTSVTAFIPAGATSGPLVVANSFGNDVSASSFTVTP
jgi:hypothetical protein